MFLFFRSPCPGHRAEVELRFISLLTGVNGFGFDGDRLVLYYDSLNNCLLPALCVTGNEKCSYMTNILRFLIFLFLNLERKW